MEIKDKLQQIFRDFFDNDSLVLKMETKLSDVDGWDSFAQINIVLIVESEFGIKFKISEIQELQNIEMWVKIIESKV